MSIITYAALESSAATAADNLSMDLKLPGTDGWDIPDQKAWAAATIAQRCLIVGGWMQTAAAAEADRMDGPPVAFTPIGGDKYAHNND
jgi:hypothetical protein